MITPFNEGHGFLLRDGQFTIVDFPGVPETQAFSINDDGVIVGRIRTKDDLLHGFKAVPDNDRDQTLGSRRSGSGWLSAQIQVTQPAIHIGG